jgi:hypothetical protein
MNVRASDCGSEGYGFKPRRPPHSKHEPNGQDATGRDTAGTDKDRNRVPALPKRIDVPGHPEGFYELDPDAHPRHGGRAVYRWVRKSQRELS